MYAAKLTSWPSGVGSTLRQLLGTVQHNKNCICVKYRVFELFSFKTSFFLAQLEK